MEPLILIGGGGHCKSVIEAAESCGRTILGVLDVADNVGSKVLDYTIIGTDQDIPQYADKAEFIITVGHIKSSEVRQVIAKRVTDANGKFATVIASTANVSKYAQIEAGTVVLHGAMVNAGAIIGRNCIINTLANIEHDALIGDFCHISTGAMVNGDCKIGQDTFLGSQSVMLNGVKIPQGCVIAAGSFVRKTIRENGIYAGNPAILMKKL